MEERWLRRLAADAAPEKMHSESAAMVTQDWIVRTARTLPGPEALDVIALRVSRGARDALSSQSGLDDQEIALLAPRLDIFAVDSLHAIVRTTYPYPSRKGHESIVALHALLQGVDAALDVEDLQGYPKRYWFQLGYGPVDAIE